MEDIRYSLSEESDAEKIAALELECFSMPWSEKSIRDLILSQNGIYICAKAGDALAGYVGMYICADEGMITNIAVFPDYRRQHIGRSLIEELKRTARLRALSKLCLEVRESNSAAIRLYEKCGFEKVGLRKGYYSFPKENAVLFDLVLND